MILYDYWRSSASYRVRIGLALKGIAHERVAVDLIAGEQRAESWRALNPQGLVPALRVGDALLTQSLAILEWLEETHPHPALLPADPVARARARAIALAVACDIHPLSNLRVLNRIEELAGADARQAWNLDNIRNGLDAVEIMLDGAGDFAFDGRPGWVECCLIPQLYNARRWGLDLARWPRAARIEANALALPAFAESAPAY